MAGQLVEGVSRAPGGPSESCVIAARSGSTGTYGICTGDLLPLSEATTSVLSLGWPVVVVVVGAMCSPSQLRGCTQSFPLGSRMSRWLQAAAGWWRGCSRFGRSRDHTLGSHWVWAPLPDPKLLASSRWSWSRGPFLVKSPGQSCDLASDAGPGSPAPTGWELGPLGRGRAACSSVP